MYDLGTVTGNEDLQIIQGLPEYRLEQANLDRISMDNQYMNRSFHCVLCFKRGKETYVIKNPSLNILDDPRIRHSILSAVAAQRIMAQTGEFHAGTSGG